MKVIILHGLYMHGMVMKPLSYKLSGMGYQTQVLTYNSLAIDEQRVFSDIDQALSLKEPNVLVGHSLGGLIIKHYLKARRPSVRKISHVVAIGSPLQGASIASRIEELGMGVILGNAPDFGLTEHEEEWDFVQKLGSIAGTLPIGARSILLQGDQKRSDGTVTVEETKIPGMTDHIEIYNSHTSLIYGSATLEQIHHFIQRSHFKH
ncbi:lipase/acyltransferase domain-containing protein [Vibrio salilacus]|uniref:lipase/acyltransferase domain-containing protein n=1 Tax=Vibrio salilacus TaxID=1323749 RepID=UPI000C29C49F|nr:cobinamide adenolsyltransferase [Vibrio salilacus]